MQARNEEIQATMLKLTILPESRSLAGGLFGGGGGGGHHGSGSLSGHGGGLGGTLMLAFLGALDALAALFMPLAALFSP